MHGPIRHQLADGQSDAPRPLGGLVAIRARNPILGPKREALGVSRERIRRLETKADQPRVAKAEQVRCRGRRTRDRKTG
jgi:hypothetical protein